MLKIIIVIALVLGLSACTSSPLGSYSSGFWMDSRYLEIKNDQTFYMNWWSDDGGLQCDASGSWEWLDDKKEKIVTKVQIRNKYIDSLKESLCLKEMPTESMWLLRGNSLYRDGNKKYSRLNEKK